MKGYVITENKTMEWRDFPVPKVNPYGALVKTEIVSPCTTDVHAFQTNYARAPHMIGRPFGHEMVGTVYEVGSEVKDFKPGDRVAVSAAIPNPRSLEAQAGQPKNNDTSYFFLNHPERAGCFVELYYILDADMTLARIPESVTMEQALMATDMLATATAGVQELEMKFGDSVVVLGIGPVGLSGVQAAVIHGAGRVFAIGSRKVCFDLAKEYGATDFIDYHDADYIQQVLELNGGPVDRVLVAGGPFATIGEGLRMLRKGGVLVNVTSFAHETDGTIPSNAWTHEKTMKSIMAVGGRYHIEKIFKLIEYGRIQPEKLITHTFHGKDKLGDSIQLFLDLDRSLIKPIVYFD